MKSSLLVSLAVATALGSWWYLHEDTEQNVVELPVTKQQAAPSSSQLSTTQSEPVENRHTAEPVLTEQQQTLDCEQALIDYQSPSFLEQKRRLLIEELLRSIPDEQRSISNQHLLAAAGLNKAVQQSINRQQTEQTSLSGESVIPDPSMMEQLAVHIKNLEYGDITDLIIDRKLSKLTRFANYTLLETIYLYDLELSAGSWQMLIASGLPVSKRLIKWLIRHPEQAELFSTTLDSYTSNKAFSPAELRRLAEDSIRQLNPVAVRNFIDRGATFSGDVNKSPLLLLPEPADQQQQQAFVDIYLILSQQGMNTAPAFLAANIEQWLPKDLLKSTPVIQDENTQLTEEAAAVSSQIADVNRDIEQQIQYARQIEQECSLDASISSGETAKSTHQGIYEKQIQSYGANNNQGFIDDEHKDELASARTMVKQIVHSLEMRSKDGHQQIRDDLEDFRKLVARREWKKALDMAKAAKLDDPDKGKIYFRTLMEQAAQHANITTLKQIIAAGGKLPDGMIAQLAATGDLERTRTLQPLGLNFSFIDGFGRNAISFAMMPPGHYDMIEFLLDQDVSVKPTSKGLDPLDYALKFVNHDKRYQGLIRLLIDNGAPVEKSHRQKIQLLKFSNPELYNELVLHIPELRISG